MRFIRPYEWAIGKLDWFTSNPDGEVTHACFANYCRNAFSPRPLLIEPSPATRREAIFTVFIWIAACVYTVGYAALNAYGPVGRHGTLMWGMPSWVVYGVLAPWFVVTVVTVWYALFCMKDEDLGEDFAANE